MHMNKITEDDLSEGRMDGGTLDGERDATKWRGWAERATRMINAA